MPENGNTPEINIHPMGSRNGSPLRTFSVDGKLGRLVAELDDDLQPHTVVEILSHDGDEVARRIAVDRVFHGSDGMARSCIENALGIEAGKR